MFKETLRLIVVSVVILIVLSCKDETTKKDCGCDSNNKTLVSNQTGTLLKDSLTGSFYIYKLEPGPMYVIDSICNQEKASKIPPGSIVIYSGYRSATCDSTQMNTGQTFKSDVTLTQIQVFYIY